jgi:hypothetical protein
MSGVSRWNVRSAGGENISMQGSLEIYPRTAVERAMKVKEVILWAMAKKVSWWQAAGDGDYWHNPPSDVVLAGAV